MLRAPEGIAKERGCQLSPSIWPVVCWCPEKPRNCLAGKPCCCQCLQCKSQGTARAPSSEAGQRQLKFQSEINSTGEGLLSQTSNFNVINRARRMFQGFRKITCSKCMFLFKHGGWMHKAVVTVFKLLTRT